MNGELAEVYHSEKSGELLFEQSNYRSRCTFEANVSNEVIEKNQTRIVIIALPICAHAQKSTAIPIKEV